MIRSSLLAFASLGFLWVANPANALAGVAAIQPLVHFDTPGHQTADVMPIAYHCHYRHHHRYCHH